MSAFSHRDLQKSIYQTLTSSAPLMAIINGVYDRPPQGTAKPYIVIGESVSTDWSSKTTAGMEQVVSIHVWSQEGGRKEAAVIMELVYSLLHQSNISVDGHELVLMRFLSSEIILENDGYTYHGQMRLSALLQSLV